MSARTRQRQSVLQVFAWPLAIGLAAVAGLVLGLTGDGLPDVAAWLLVGLAPSLAIAGALRRARRNFRRHNQKALP